MNTRIAELVAAEMAEYFDGVYASNDGAKDQLRQFAERIVRECAEVASDYDGAHYVGEAVEKHFGVE
jgi:hypothetical protein